MEAEEYYEFLSKDNLLDGVSIPVEPEPGEEPYDAILRWLIENEIFVEDGDVYYIDLEKAAAFDPALAEWGMLLVQAELYSNLDHLEEKGLIYSSVDADGNMVWGVTSAGEEEGIDWLS